MIASAKCLLDGKGKPSQANLKRATSTAYYALFHCLARTSADLLVGGAGANRSDPAWRQVYRALDHGSTKRACLDNAIIQKFPKPVEDFASLFVTLQLKRHEADYDPFSRFTKSGVEQDIDMVEKVIANFSSAPIKDRRAFCAFVLFKKR